MPDVTFQIEVYCDTCGEGLCNQTTFTETRHRHEPSLRVEVCQKCLERARSEGYDEGYAAAQE